MAINPYVKKVDNEDHSFLGQIAKPVGLLGGLATLATPFLPAAAAVSTAANAVGQAAQATAPEPGVGKGPTAVNALGGDAMGRKFEQMANDPGVQIADANASMAKMPPDVQQEFGPALSQAQKLTKQRRF